MDKTFAGYLDQHMMFSKTNFFLIAEISRGPKIAFGRYHKAKIMTLFSLQKGYGKYHKKGKPFRPFFSFKKVLYHISILCKYLKNPQSYGIPRKILKFKIIE